MSKVKEIIKASSISAVSDIEKKEKRDVLLKVIEMEDELKVRSLDLPTYFFIMIFCSC